MSDHVEQLKRRPIIKGHGMDCACAGCMPHVVARHTQTVALLKSEGIDPAAESADRLADLQEHIRARDEKKVLDQIVQDAARGAKRTQLAAQHAEDVRAKAESAAWWEARL